MTAVAGVALAVLCAVATRLCLYWAIAYRRLLLGGARVDQFTLLRALLAGCRGCFVPNAYRITRQAWCHYVLGALMLFWVVWVAYLSFPHVLGSLLLGMAAILVFAAAAIDARTGYLPDALTYPLMVGGLGVCMAGYLPISLLESLGGAIAGYGIPAGISSVYCLVRGRAGIGGGDSKLLAALGVWLGCQAVMPILLCACVLALLRVTLEAIQTRCRWVGSRAVSFGPYLALGAAAVIVAQSALQCPFCNLG